MTSLLCFLSSPFRRYLSGLCLCCLLLPDQAYGQAGQPFDPAIERDGEPWSPGRVEFDFDQPSPRADVFDDFAQTDELLIAFPADRLQQVLDLCRQQGINVNEVLDDRFFGPSSHFLLRGRIPQGFDQDRLRKIRDDGNVSRIEPNRRYTYRFPKPVARTQASPDPPQARESDVIPDDPALRTAGTWGLRAIRAPRAWSAIRESVVMVAVIDTGVDYRHNDIHANVARNAGRIHGYDFCGDSEPEDRDPDDIEGHGTHCAGVIGSVGNNGVGLSGVCWKVPILPVKIFRQTANGESQGGSDADVAKAIYYAVRQGARVLSCSFGHPGPGSDSIMQALRYAQANDVLIVAAAGNDGINIDQQPFFPATAPFDNILTVAAVDQRDQRPDWGTSTTNYGRREVDIAAPGHGILSCVPDFAHPDTYAEMNGTSMATPFVAGAAALVWSHPKYRHLSAVEIRELLMRQARPVPGLADTCASSAVLDIGFLADEGTGTSPSPGNPVPPSLVQPDPPLVPVDPGPRLPDNPTFWRGYQAWRNRDFTLAISQFRQAAKETPDDPRPLYFHAIASLTVDDEQQFGRQLLAALRREQETRIGPFEWGRTLEFFQGPNRARLEVVRRNHLDGTPYVGVRQLRAAWAESLGQPVAGRVLAER